MLARVFRGKSCGRPALGGRGASQQGWDDQFLAGEEFEQFLAEDQEQTRSVLEQLGLV